MKRIRSILLVSLLMSSSCCFGQTLEGQKTSKLTQAECLNLLKTISTDWLKDSVNNNGIRKGIRPKFGWEYRGRLDSLKGVKWKVVGSYLGLPDFVLKHGHGQPTRALPEHMDSMDNVTFLFYLNRLPGETFTTQAGLYMQIYVSEGMIKNIWIHEIDG